MTSRVKRQNAHMRKPQPGFPLDLATSFERLAIHPQGDGCAHEPLATNHANLASV
jgi:hypothetical protein